MNYFNNPHKGVKRGDIFYISNSKFYSTDPSNEAGRPGIVVSKDRLGDYIRTCSEREMAAINRGMLCYLGISLPVEEKPISHSTEEDMVKLVVEKNLYKSLYEQLLGKLTVAR